VRDKLNFMIRDDIIRQFMIFEYILKIKLSDIFHSDFDNNRIEVNYFHKSIDVNKSDIKVI